MAAFNDWPWTSGGLIDGHPGGLEIEEGWWRGKYSQNLFKYLLC